MTGLVCLAVVAMTVAISATEGWMRRALIVFALLLGEVSFGAEMVSHIKKTIWEDWETWLGFAVFGLLVVIVYRVSKREEETRPKWQKEITEALK